MSYVNNQGVKIYYEVEGEGPLIITARLPNRNLDFVA